MKYLLLVTLASLYLSAQTFSMTGTTFASVTDGGYHCYFWLLSDNPNYDMEVACYENNTLVGGVHAKRAGDKLIDFFKYPNMQIGWIIKETNSFEIAALRDDGLQMGRWVGVFSH